MYLNFTYGHNNCTIDHVSRCTMTTDTRRAHRTNSGASLIRAKGCCRYTVNPFYIWNTLVVHLTLCRHIFRNILWLEGGIIRDWLNTFILLKIFEKIHTTRNTAIPFYLKFLIAFNFVTSCHFRVVGILIQNFFCKKFIKCFECSHFNVILILVSVFLFFNRI